jgi:hypothetical protein
MQTRSKNHIHKPREFRDVTIPYPPPKALVTMKATHIEEPTSFTTANQSLHWRAAMNSEFNALLQNGTWILVPRQPHMNLVGCKWISSSRENLMGLLIVTRLSLVAKGFHQQPGIDYGDTFSPVVKPTTIRTVFYCGIIQLVYQTIGCNKCFFTWIFAGRCLHGPTARLYTSFISGSCVSPQKVPLWIETSP